VKKQPVGFGLKGTNSITALAKSKALDILKGAELVVWIRLLGLADTAGTNKVRVENVDLHHNRGGRTAQTAINSLAAQGLIRVKQVSVGWRNRTIEVL
jgi:hypothetical protein